MRRGQACPGKSASLVSEASGAPGGLRTLCAHMFNLQRKTLLPSQPLERAPVFGPGHRKPKAGGLLQSHFQGGGSPFQMWGQWMVGKGSRAGPGRLYRRPQNRAVACSKFLLCLLGEGASKTISKPGGSPVKGASFPVGRGGISKGTLLLKRFQKTLAFLSAPNHSLASSSRERVPGKCFQGDVSLSHHNCQGLDAAKPRRGPPL